MKSIHLAVGLAILSFLTGCQTTRPTGNTFSIPVYQGVVQPISSPVTIGSMPLSRRVALGGETTMEVTEGSKTTRATTGLEGYAESYRLGEAIQVTFGINRVSQNGAWQTIPPIIIQMSIDPKDQVERFNVGGALLDQATPDQRQQIEAITKPLSKIVNRSKTPGPYRHGDIVTSMSASDFFSEFGVVFSELRDKSVSGTGINGRLIGETQIQGRRMFVLAVDGNLEISDASGRVSASFGGYYLIDAMTGMYAANHVLTQAAGTGRGTTFSYRELQRMTLSF